MSGNGQYSIFDYYDKDALREEILHAKVKIGTVGMIRGMIATNTDIATLMNFVSVNYPAIADPHTMTETIIEMIKNGRYVIRNMKETTEDV